MTSFTEKHEFLEINGNSLYCSFFSPVDKTIRGVVILCKPIWGERIRTHRIYKNLGIMLAEIGFEVVTFDYYADGNSAGQSYELEFDKMVENVLEVAQLMKNMYEIESIILIGIRMGATVSLFANEQSNYFQKVIAFEPILNLKKYSYDGLRINISMQMTRYKKILTDREGLLRKLDLGEFISLDGFIVGKQFYYSFADKEIHEKMLKKSNVIMGVFEQSKVLRDLKKITKNAEEFQIELLPKEFDWTAWKSYVNRPKHLFDWVKKVIQNLEVGVLSND